MNRSQVDNFFIILSNEFKNKARIILTGAAAGALWGMVRPSMDVDFEIQLMSTKKDDWESLENAISRTIQRTGISANFSENIDRWGLISLLDYKKHVSHYQKFGLITVNLLKPEYWSIGKMTRYLNPDIRDMIKVFIYQNILPDGLVKLWGKAIKNSPKSNIQQQFKMHVENFMKKHGKQIWGKNFNSARYTKQFYIHAGIQTPH